MTKNYRPDHDSQINQQFVDALRECLGLEPLYQPVSALTRQISPIQDLAYGHNPRDYLKSVARPQ